MTAELSYYLGELRAGHVDRVYVDLVQLDDSYVSALIDAYKTETDVDVKAVLVEVIYWHHRLPEIVTFLAEALRHPNPKIWHNALDGLVAFGTPECLETLKKERAYLVPDANSSDAATRIEWVDEAIDQINHGFFN